MTAHGTDTVSLKICKAVVPSMEPGGRRALEVERDVDVLGGEQRRRRPAGVQNFSGIPSFIPPASSSSSRSVVPIGASYWPGRVTCPDSE